MASPILEHQETTLQSHPTADNYKNIPEFSPTLLKPPNRFLEDRPLPCGYASDFECSDCNNTSRPDSLFLAAFIDNAKI